MLEIWTQIAKNELLMHVAAGTDPLTALAALPHEADAPSVESLAETPSQQASSAWIAFVVLVAVAALLLIR